MRVCKTVLATLVVTALAVGCGTSREEAWDTTPTANAGGTSSDDQAMEAGNQAWAGRDEVSSVDQAIASYSTATEADPSNYEAWVALSRAYYFKADCHTRFEEGQEEAFLSTFESGTQAAERGLMAISDDFAERMRNGTRIEEAVSVLEANAVPALYWRSSNLGKWASADGFATLLSYKDEIRAVMQRCLELDAEYYYYGPDRYFGVFYGRAPSFAGGDLERSREHFEASLAQQPNYFATHVLMAQDFAVKSQDRALFEEQLNWVLENDPESLPDVAPENRCEQRKARLLLATADEVFE